MPPLLLLLLLLRPPPDDDDDDDDDDEARGKCDDGAVDLRAAMTRNEGSNDLLCSRVDVERALPTDVPSFERRVPAAVVDDGDDDVEEEVVVVDVVEDVDVVAAAVVDGVETCFTS